MPAPARDPVADLRRIAFLLERAHADTYRVRAYRGAAEAIDAMPRQQVQARADGGTLTSVRGVGAKTAAVVMASLAGEIHDTLARLERDAKEPLVPLTPDASRLQQALRGDCHTHSSFSDGGSSPLEMARAARDDVGHEWIVLTDHSPRLTVANGLSPQRLAEQLDLVARINDTIAPFQLLTGIEVDINPDGTLDQQPDLLARLDVVVGSVHSELRMPAAQMTARMRRAIDNPHLDVLGHCTGRLVAGPRSPRAPSAFDAEAVIAACVERGVALEVNARPERLDPPRHILRLAVEAGCLLSIDTDAHAPGQLAWQPYGVARAVECGASADRVVTTWPAQRVLEWTSARA